MAYLSLIDRFNKDLTQFRKTFNENYYSLILALTKALGTKNPNDIGINSIAFGSVIVRGSA